MKPSGAEETRRRSGALVNAAEWRIHRDVREPQSSMSH